MADLEKVSQQCLERLAALAPASSTDAGINNTEKFDVPAFIKRHDLSVAKSGHYSCAKLGAGHRWELEVCPFDAEHTDRSAFIIQFESGIVTFGCHHNGCAGKDWKALRARLEPPATITLTAPTVKPTVQAKEPLVDVSRRWRSFPVDALPEPMAGYVREASAAIGCDPSFVALPLISCLAAAVGNTRQIELKSSWHEPCIFWTCIIGESGTHKTPAFSAVTRPIHIRQEKEMNWYKEQMKQFERDCVTYDAELRRWRQNRGDNQPQPEKPREPVCPRYVVSDITVEALAERLAENPRGLLVVRDEISGWINSFNQYRGGRGGDTGHWLSMFNALQLVVDRKTGPNKIIIVPKASVSIAGGIQPETLRRSLGVEHFTDGLAARVLFAWPPRGARRYSEATISSQIQGHLATVLNRLGSLEFGTGDAPVDLPLSADAQRTWISFYNVFGEIQSSLTGNLAAAASKLEGYVARLALLFHLVRCAFQDPALKTVERIDTVSIKSAVTLVEWFFAETERIYATLDEGPDQQQARQLMELVERNGGEVTANELRKLVWRYSTSEEAEQALSGLSKAGLGTWEVRKTGENGGRPKCVFRLHEIEAASPLPRISRGIRGLGYGDAPDGVPERDPDASDAWDEGEV